MVKKLILALVAALTASCVGFPGSWYRLDGAVYNNDPKQIERILEVYKPNPRDPDGAVYRAMRKACLQDADPAILAQLLDYGASPTRADAGGRTPLHFTSMGVAPALTRVLLDRGADPRVADRGGQTPLHLACQPGLATRTGYQEPPPTEEEHATLVRLLLEHGADPNAVDARGNTPLYWALVEGQPGCLDALIEHGAALDQLILAQALDGAVIETLPLHRAAMQGDAELVRVLLRHGAAPSRKDTHGKTPLQYAMAYNAPSPVVQLLRE